MLGPCSADLAPQVHRCAARPEIQDPPPLKRLIVDLIEPVQWSAMKADVKGDIYGDIYEGLLAKSAAESPKGAGQYFTPRELIRAVVDCVQPGPNDTVCDPAAGTGGFLLAAHDFVVRPLEYGLQAASSVPAACWRNHAECAIAA